MIRVKDKSIRVKVNGKLVKGGPKTTFPCRYIETMEDLGELEREVGEDGIVAIFNYGWDLKQRAAVKQGDGKAHERADLTKWAGRHHAEKFYAKFATFAVDPKASIRWLSAMTLRYADDIAHDRPAADFEVDI